MYFNSIARLLLDYRVVAVIFVNAFIQLSITKQLNGDDAQFSNFANDFELLAYLKERYFSWSSRTPIEAAMHLVINHMWLWRALNFLALMLLTFSISRLTWNLASNLRQHFFFIFALVLAVPLAVSEWGAWWVTGSFNYLWPAALAMFSFIPFKLISENKKVPFVLCLAAVVCGSLASFNEQIVVFEMGFYIAFCWVFRKEVFARHKTLLVGILFYGLVLVYILVSPGNAARSSFEVGNWYPDFEMLSFLDKAYLGISLSLNNFWRASNWLALALCFLVFLKLVVDRRDLITISYSLLPLLFFVVGMFIHTIASPGMTGLDDLYSALFNYSPVEAKDLIYPEKFLPFAFGIYMSLTLAYCAYIAISDRFSLKALLVVALIAASFAAASMIGLSPTMYASGERVNLIPNYLLVVASGIFLSENINLSSPACRKGLTYGFSLFFILCALREIY